MGYPPPPPPPGAPGGYGPPPGPPGGPAYGAPTGPPPGGYGGPPPPGGYGGPPPPPGSGPGSGSASGSGSGGSKGPLILLMGAIVIVVLLAVVGGLILLTRDGGGDVELTEAQRTDALLTEGDVGGGYIETSGDDEDDDGQPEADGACRDTLDELEAEGAGPFSRADLPPGAAERGFEDEATGSTIDHDIAPAVDVIDIYERFVADCDELTFDDGDGTATFSIDERDAPDVGDDAIALDITVSAEAEGFSFEVEGVVVAWTRDGNDSVIAYLGGIDDETFAAVPIDEDLLDEIVATADDKLAEVIEEA